jgi:hypothetical protein
VSLPSKTKFDPTQPVTQGSSGQPVQSFRDYMTKLDALVAAMAAGNLPTLINAANDAAAKAKGVPVQGIYRNGSVLMQRQV